MKREKIAEEKLMNTITKINRVILAGKEYKTEGYSFSTKHNEITTFKDPGAEGNIVIFMKNLKNGNEFVHHTFIREDALRILLVLSLAMEDSLDTMISNHKSKTGGSVCHWVRDKEQNEDYPWLTWCGERVSESSDLDYTYCPYCGGRLIVEDHEEE